VDSDHCRYLAEPRSQPNCVGRRRHNQSGRIGHCWRGGRKLGDIIAGVFLASDPDFGTGFTITSKAITGTIERIDLRKTRIRAEDGKLHVVPNKMIENEVWIVEGRPAALPPLIQRPRRKSDADPGAQSSAPS
jgi:Mechanosensitive ion channel